MLLWLCSNLCWLNVLNTRQNLNDTAKLAQSFELNSYDSFILKFHSTSIRLKHSHGYCIHFNEKILHSDGIRKTTNRSEHFENPSFTAVRLFFRSLCSVCSNNGDEFISLNSICSIQTENIRWLIVLVFVVLTAKISALECNKLNLNK